MDERVKQYAARIGVELPEEIRPDYNLLRRLHFAHCTTVPYENLDILRGVPLSLDIDRLFEKVVEQRRGGYCFELNGLFAWLLRRLGYGVREYAGRFLRHEEEIPMRRHRVLAVKTEDGAVYLCDVGTGQAAPRWPILLREGMEQRQFGECYRFERDGFLGWVLTELHEGEWRDAYSFTEEAQLPVDFEAVNFYCQYSPDSIFNKQEKFALKTIHGRITLDGHTFREYYDGEVVTTELTDAELPAAYAKFGLKY